MVQLESTLRQSQVQVPILRFVSAGLSIVAAVLLLLSVSMPWWGLVMYAPQYPQGLTVVSTLKDTGGDVSELNGLNHYIGMMPIEDAAPIERSLAVTGVWVAAAAAIVAVFFRRRIGRWLRLPALAFPFVFLIDLQIWLWYAGNHLDPKAAFSSTIKAFTPRMLGDGKIAQFSTYGWVETGWWLAITAAALILIADWLHVRQEHER